MHDAQRSPFVRAIANYKAEGDNCPAAASNPVSTSPFVHLAQVAFQEPSSSHEPTLVYQAQASNRTSNQECGSMQDNYRQHLTEPMLNLQIPVEKLPPPGISGEIRVPYGGFASPIASRESNRLYGFNESTISHPLGYQRTDGHVPSHDIGTNVSSNGGMVSAFANIPATCAMVSPFSNASNLGGMVSPFSNAPNLGGIASEFGSPPVVNNFGETAHLFASSSNQHPTSVSKVDQVEPAKFPIISSTSRGNLREMGSRDSSTPPGMIPCAVQNHEMHIVISGDPTNSSSPSRGGSRGFTADMKGTRAGPTQGNFVSAFGGDGWSPFDSSPTDPDVVSDKKVEDSWLAQQQKQPSNDKPGAQMSARPRVSFKGIEAKQEPEKNDVNCPSVFHNWCLHMYSSSYWSAAW